MRISRIHLINREQRWWKHVSDIAVAGGNDFVENAVAARQVTPVYLHRTRYVFVCGFGGCDSCSCGRDDANDDNDADNNIFGGCY